MTVEEILGRLDCVHGGHGQWNARCPAHADSHNSLSVSVGKDGKVLFNCHAGCTVDEIAGALGLTVKDLFTEDKPQEQKKIIAEYCYYSPEGISTAHKVRYSPKGFTWRRWDSKKGWIYSRKGVTPSLYCTTVGSNQLPGSVFLVEGEKDVDTIGKTGKAAVSLPDGCESKWQTQYDDALTGKTVVIIQDNDKPGKEYAQRVAGNLSGVAQSVRVLDLCNIWPELPEHGDTTDLINHMGEADGMNAILQLAMDSPEWTQDTITSPQETAGEPQDGGTDWEPPIPFDTVETPDFPVESLPGAVADFVECLADSTQTPEEMAGVLSLGVLSTAFQSKYTVEITSNWREPLCLYTVAIAPPGERKSAVISALMKPVYEYEAERRQAEAAEVEQNRSDRALLEKQKQAAEINAVKKKGNFESCRDEVLSIAAQLATFEDKHPYRLVVDDTTPEKLVDIMDTQDGCITVASAEGGLFDSLAGRYDKAGNFDVYLKGHAGDAITVDRIGRKPNYIKSPRLSMLLTIQPEVLQGLMDNSTFRGRGLCGRFLYAVCKSKVGHRKIETDTIPEKVKIRYQQFVRHILSDTGSGVIRLSAEADTIRKEYAGYIEQKLGDDWEYMRDWGGKLVGATVRIAALMHAAEATRPTETPISGEVI